ncbi:hypothetical protein [Streptomyces candidus]|uniref:Uncharacterized protein n=1 Tax=Streptomyces candidus TaxID=67283 RepID=A0A7X0HMK5_9ACTN|nr:hypothetical protein [Streptomyces candidus]MBB6438908.1 hypothetical protein [Streptomyces candidus]GHH52507.1 hypothetical protein GCM10018773_52620 [Streptomyces candidus]
MLLTQARSGRSQHPVRTSQENQQRSERWDTGCIADDAAHAFEALRDFHARRGVETLLPSVEVALTAGKLYEHCIAQHVMGSEVLSFCHAAPLAEREGLPLGSVNETRYCCVPISSTGSMPVHFA